jgi:fructokinase
MVSEVFTVVGEALVDLIATGDLSAPTVHPGGSPANVALGLARLGHCPVLLTQLGPDPHGRLIRDHLESDGVEVVNAGPATATTSSAATMIDAAGVASYRFDLSWQVRELTTAAGSKALHVGSLGLTLSPGADAVLDLVRRVHDGGHQIISYDPNLRRHLVTDRASTIRRVDEVAAISDIVKLSDEDLALIADRAEPEWAASRWLHGTGRTQLVVVTRGVSGAWAATRQQVVRVATIAVPTVDTVGAGDAFMAGLLAALTTAGGLSPTTLPDVLADDRLTEVLNSAATAAALTCTRPGADPPTALELRAFRGPGFPAPPRARSTGQP